jgi:hypothetical protein
MRRTRGGPEGQIHLQCPGAARRCFPHRRQHARTRRVSDLSPRSGALPRAERSTGRFAPNVCGRTTGVANMGAMSSRHRRRPTPPAPRHERRGPVPFINGPSSEPPAGGRSGRSGVARTGAATERYRSLRSQHAPRVDAWSASQYFYWHSTRFAGPRRHDEPHRRYARRPPCQSWARASTPGHPALALAGWPGRLRGHHPVAACQRPAGRVLVPAPAQPRRSLCRA